LNFDLYRLRVFCSVVEHKSFTRAAQELLSTQPAISVHVRALEHAFGAELLDRSRRQIASTEAGAVVYAFAQEVLTRMNETAQTVAELSSGAQGRLRLGATTNTGNYVLPPLLADFRAEHPGARLRMRVGTRNRVLDELVTGDVEFAYIEVGEVPSGLRAERMHSEDLVFIAAPSHLLAGSPAIDPDRLREQDLVTGISGASYYAESVARQLQPLGLMPTLAAFEMGSPEATKRLVVASAAVGLLPRSAVAAELARGELVELAVQPTHLRISYELVYAASAKRTPLATSFIDFIRGRIGSQRATT
jgi:DNA-binding transcriptional LysR family regulator